MSRVRSRFWLHHFAAGRRFSGDYETKLGEQKVPGMQQRPEHKENFTNLCNFLVKLRTAANAEDGAPVVDEPKAWLSIFPSPGYGPRPR